MATLYSQKDSNIRKTWLLMSVFLVLIIAIGFAFSYAYNAPEVLYFAVAFSIGMNLLAYWNSDKIALAMSGAKAIPREGNEYVYRMIENLCITAGLPMPRVYLIDSPQINAFATGRNPEHAAIAVTRGAVEKLENEELEGVLAHELSHIGNRDILVSTVAVVLAGLIAILADLFLRIGFHGGFGGSDNRRGNAGAVMLAIGLVAAILAPLAATLIRLSISRKREYLADVSGALLTRYPDGLANALEKIGHDQQPARFAKTATAHLFIANPFKADVQGQKKVSWFARLFMTHPPIQDRIKVLRDMRI